MLPRKRVLAILNRQPVDRLPVDLWHTPEISALLRQHCGVTDDLAMYRALGLDKIVWAFLDYYTASGEIAGSQAGAGAEEGGNRTMWGVPLKDVSVAGGHYAEFAAAPLEGYNTPESLNDYPWWPSIERFNYEELATKAEEAAKDFAVVGPWVSLFEIYCQLRGMENSLIDLVESPKLVDAILDRVEEIQSEMMRRFFARAGKWLDLVFVSDDIAGQNSLFMSPGLWKRYLQPRLRRWCDLIHAHGLKVFYHTDGAARLLLSPILDCGVDVLNPIQHTCPGMDMEELKHEFGDRVIFHGGVDNQFALSRGTPEDVRRETRHCLDALGAGKKGYICCSCHNVQPGTPLENILAMIETVQRASADAGL